MSTIDRRALLRAGLLLPTAGALAACTAGPPASHEQSGSTLIGPVSPQVRATEARRTRSGRTRAVTLTATAGTVDLGGPMVTTWTYDGLLPGREIRASRGDVIEARLVNRLPSDTTVHWHGLALRNDMDGVPGVTQATVRPGAGFTYRFTADAADTYWLHPHVGPQGGRLPGDEHRACAPARPCPSRRRDPRRHRPRRHSRDRRRRPRHGCPSGSRRRGPRQTHLHRARRPALRT